MDEIFSMITSTATALVDGIDVIKNCIGLIFNLFPPEIKTLLVWGVGFLFVVSIIKFIKK